MPLESCSGRIEEGSTVARRLAILSSHWYGLPEKGWGSKALGQTGLQSESEAGFHSPMPTKVPDSFLRKC